MSEKTAPNNNDADVIIVGGGSAGAVLAARLSEDPGRRVLLVEAGRDTLPGSVPEDIVDTFPRSYSNPAYTWPKLKARIRPGIDSRPYTQARVMGGGSSLMGMWALRGLKSDYDGWQDSGALGWGWEDVYPFFQKLERDPLHNSFHDAGNVAIRRIETSEWPPYIQSIEQAANSLGFRSDQNINEAQGDGFFPIPLSQENGARVSSASAYLSLAVRRRPNLRIVTETEVLQIDFDGKVVKGLSARNSVGSVYFAANEVIVCAGAIHSPALLLRSGIGPAEELHALGISPVANLPFVGRNLQNHACINLGLTLPAAQRQDSALRNYGVACLRASSLVEGGTPSDLLLAFIGRTSMRPLGTRLGILGIFLYDPQSRGVVNLRRSHGELLPHIEFNLLAASEDSARLASGLELALKLLSTESTANTWQDCVLLPPTLPLHRLNRPGLIADLQAAAGVLGFGAGSWMRRSILTSLMGKDAFINPRNFGALSRERLENMCQTNVAPMFHVAGTCAMGAKGNVTTVVDPDCRVMGVSGLRVADASIMPRLPRANTNLPTMMIGERVAQLFRTAN